MKIALFFTENVSLESWHHAGTLRRDCLLYEKLCELGHEVYFVTYGRADDVSYLPPDSPIQVLTRPEGIGLRHYSWNMYRVHGDVLREVDVIKSHQVNGARFATYAKLRLGNKPYIARCGYLPSVFLAKAKAPLKVRIRNWIEEFASFHMANAICVPSHAEIEYLNRRYGINTKKAHACPNWIDTELFQPDPNTEKNPRQVCFVGRFEAQKDPFVLLDALRDIPDVELLMIGGGTLKPEIESRIAAYGIRARVLDRVDNDALPGYLNASAVYALPTRYEGGSPKTLFEAMACGLPVVSTDGFGVTEAFEDGAHGYKVHVGDVAGVRQAIQKLLDNPDQAREMGLQGRQHVIDHYSIDRAVYREITILEGLMG